ncbi:MAG TPA: hypothetical protein VGJ82_04180, partial [Thermoanaerobaculia bacterium]
MNEEVFTAALAALSEARGSEVDFEDPRQVASLRALSFLETAADLPDGYGSSRRVVDTTAPRVIRETYPHSDAQHLFIMAWAATCERSDGRIEPTDVSWLNISLLHLIDRVVREDCRAQCDKGSTCTAPHSCELGQLYKSYTSNERTRMPLNRFLLDLACPDQREFVKDFYDALQRAPLEAIEKSTRRSAIGPPKPAETRSEGLVDDEVPRARVFAFPFLNPVTNKRRWIVGARLAPWNGVRLRLPAATA